MMSADQVALSPHRSGQTQNIDDGSQRQRTGRDEFPIDDPGPPFQFIGELAFRRIDGLAMAPQHPAEPGQGFARGRILLARGYESREAEMQKSRALAHQLP